MRVLPAVALALCALSAAAEPPADAAALSPEAALACAAARYRGEALRLEPRDGGLVQDIRWRTPAGSVLEIRLTGPGCRFLEVRGVGQTEARILPQAAP